MWKWPEIRCFCGFLLRLDNLARMITAAVGAVAFRKVLPGASHPAAMLPSPAGATPSRRHRGRGPKRTQHVATAQGPGANRRIRFYAWGTGGPQGDAKRGGEGAIVDALHDTVDRRGDSGYDALSRPVSLIL